MYRYIVGKGGVAPDYFLYRMTISEAALYLDGLNMRDRNAWHNTRWLAFVIGKYMGSKTESPADIVQFPWEIDPEKEAAELQDELNYMQGVLGNMKAANEAKNKAANESKNKTANEAKKNNQ